MPTDASRIHASQAKIPTKAIVANEATPRMIPITPATWEQSGAHRAERSRDRHQASRDPRSSEGDPADVIDVEEGRRRRELLDLGVPLGDPEER